MKKFRAEIGTKPPADIQKVIAEMSDELARMQEEATNEISRRKMKIQVDYEAEKAAQFRLAAYISRISPASVYTYSTTGLALTGFDRQESFLKMARAYKAIFMDYVNVFTKKVMKQVIQQSIAQQSGETVTSEGEKFDLKNAPLPDFMDADLAESWNLVWGDFLILFLLFACFFMIAYVGFVRSDIR